MDGVELELVCPCGFENFERVVVHRRPHAPIVTDFVACVGCRSMYFSPLRGLDPPERRVGQGMVGIGGPEKHDSAEALKRDAADAATEYRKPGKSGRLKPGGRR